MTQFTFIRLSLTAVLVAACSGTQNDPANTSGGATNTGGVGSGAGGSTSSGGNAAGSNAAGGVLSSGGATTAGGSLSQGGKAGSGGATASAGSAQGGAAQGGKAASGGATSGNASGGATAAGATGNAGNAGASGTSTICDRWKSDRMNLKEDAWNGDAASCMAGDMTQNSRDTVLRLVNLYRFIAGLPAVSFDATRNQQDQACALMMQANNTIDHMPTSDWKCYTQDGATAAGSSNLSGGAGAISAVDGYMLDPGNDTTLGHRRWILSNSLGPIGVGSTGKYSCMWTLGGTGKAGKAWMAWPSAGDFPLQAFTVARQSVDSTGWSLQSDGINLSSAQVTVTFNGTNAPVTVTQLDANYGSRYALRFNPMGWTSQAGTYHVSVSGVTTPIEYDVNVVSCN